MEEHSIHCGSLIHPAQLRRPYVPQTSLCFSYCVGAGVEGWAWRTRARRSLLSFSAQGSYSLYSVTSSIRYLRSPIAFSHLLRQSSLLYLRLIGSFFRAPSLRPLHCPRLTAFALRVALALAPAFKMAYQGTNLVPSSQQGSCIMHGFAAAEIG